MVDIEFDENDSIDVFENHTEGIEDILEENLLKTDTKIQVDDGEFLIDTESILKDENLIPREEELDEEILENIIENVVE